MLMKRVFVYLMSFVLCILMFSCAKQETPEPGSGADSGTELPDDRVPVMTLSTSIEGEKTEISTQGKVFWAKGDVLAVFAGGKAYAFELKSGVGSQNAVFACYDNDITGKTLDGVAAYPYHESLTYDNASGTVQVYCPHTYDAAAIPVPMVGQAHTDNDNRYYFRNMNGIFRFTYKNVPIKARTLQFTATTDISGVYNVAAQGGRLTTSSTSTALDANSTKTVKVSLPRMRKDGTVTVDIPVPTGAYKGFTIALLDKEGTAIDYTQKSPSSTITAYTRQISPIKAIDLPQGLKVEWGWDNNGALPRFTGNIPAIDAAGNVYIASDEAKLYKLDKNGKLLWTFTLTGLSGRNNGSPSLEEDGSVVYMAGGTTAGVLYAINADGTQKWKATFPTSLGTGTPVFDRPIVAVGKGNNVYVQVNGLKTLLSISKSDGKTVAYLATDNDGTNLNRYGAGSVAISEAGTVSVQTQQGSYTVKQSLFDAPTKTHATYGKYVPYAYHDLWPAGWNMFWVEDGRAQNLNGSVSQGVICGMKGKTSGRHIAVSCAQETNHRMNVYCYDTDAVRDTSLYRQKETGVEDYMWNNYACWRYQLGKNENPVNAPALQDQGGIIFGHNDLEVLVPMKYNETATTNTDDKKRSQDPAGLLSVWVGRDYADNNVGNTSCWRYNITKEKTATSHCVEEWPEVSGAAAVDNNAWVHLASREHYHIFAAEFLEPYTITLKEQVSWEDVLLTSGIRDAASLKVNAWSSVKIADDGRIFVPVNVYNKAGDETEGVLLCLSYPGVTSADPSSSWPQKGADARNSCRQVSDASKWTDNTKDPIAWD